MAVLIPSVKLLSGTMSGIFKKNRIFLVLVFLICYSQYKLS